MKSISYNPKTGDGLVLDSEGESNTEQLFFGLDSVIGFIYNIRRDFKCMKEHKNLRIMTKKEIKSVHFDILPPKGAKLGYCKYCNGVFTIK